MAIVKPFVRESATPLVGRIFRPFDKLQVCLVDFSECICISAEIWMVFLCLKPKSAFNDFFQFRGIQRRFSKLQTRQCGFLYARELCLLGYNEARRRFFAFGLLKQKPRGEVASMGPFFL